MKYPEHEKLAAATRCPATADRPCVGHNNVIGEFVEWLGSRGYVVARWQEGGSEDGGSCPECEGKDRTCWTCSGTGRVLLIWTGHYRPAGESIEDLLAEYYDIDRDRIEREKREMLEAARSAS